MAYPKGIYQRGEVFWFAHQVSGKRSFVSLETKDFSTAIQRAARFKEQNPKRSKDSLEMLAERFLETKAQEGSHSLKTTSWAKRIISAFLSQHGSLETASVTKSVTMKWFAGLRATMSEAGAHSYKRAMSSFFSWLVKQGHAMQNPFDFKTGQVAKIGRKEFCTRVLRDELLENAPNEMLAMVLNLGFLAGLRKNEIIEARWSWVDLQSGLLHVQSTDSFKTKNRKNRTIPLSKTLMTFLQGIENREGYMLMPEIEKGVSEYRYDFRRPFENYMAARGCQWVTAHTMRRTFASLLVSEAVSIYKVSSWLGDGVAVVENHYGHLVAQDTDIDRAG